MIARTMLQLAILPILPLFLHLLDKIPFSTVTVDIIPSYVLNAIFDDEKQPLLISRYLFDKVSSNYKLYVHTI
jgi:hypothetical protein